MNPADLKKVEANVVAGLSGVDRWYVYQRLQELSIPSWCALNQPLKVQLDNVTTAIQLWSIVRQTTASRQDLVCWLERCWQSRE
jgi:hypothetical protein